VSNKNKVEEKVPQQPPASVEPGEPTAIKEGNERVAQLLSGEAESPNKFVTYLLEKLRKARTEFEDVSSRIQQGRQFLAALEKKQLVLQGEHNKYIEDIKAWDKQVVADETESPKAVAQGE
jgi:hypothetical protein